MEDIVLVGFGGHGKSVADCIRRMGKYNIVGYTDKECRNTEYKYLGTDNKLLEIHSRGVENAVVCIGYLGKGNVRENVYCMLKDIGYKLPVISDPSAIIAETASIGEGTFIGKNAVINAEAKIGKMVIINSMALIEHECIVEDYAHIAVAAVTCGQVKIGYAAFVGANSTIIQNRIIGQREIIPAGVTIR